MDRFSKKEKFTLFVIFVLTASFFLITFIWNANSYYADAYRQPVHESKVLREKIDRVAPVSKQPRPYGASEGDIEKREGRRYKTF